MSLFCCVGCTLKCQTLPEPPWCLLWTVIAILGPMTITTEKFKEKELCLLLCHHSHTVYGSRTTRSPYYLSCQDR